MKHILLTCAFAACLTASQAFAASGGNAETVAYDAMQKGQWAQAETLLRQQLAQAPNDAIHLLNLAYVLKNSGRESEAAATYEQVLQLDRNPAVVLESERQVRAKRLAKMGIDSLNESKR
jgi:Tfp pilus assembly protein PilF